MTCLVFSAHASLNLFILHADHLCFGMWKCISVALRPSASPFPVIPYCMHRCCCRTSAAINNQHLACWGSPVPSLLYPCLSTLVFTSAGSHDSYHRNFGAWHQQSQEWSSFLKGLRVQENKACSWGGKHVSHDLRESIKRLLYFFISFTNTGRY